MRTRSGSHWLLQRVAEEQAPRASIDLWPRIQDRATRPPRAILGARLPASATRALAAVALVLLLAGSLALVSQSGALTTSTGKAEAVISALASSPS